MRTLPVRGSTKTLLRPDSGQIVIDGHDISRINVSAYRKRIATVMQEDALLAGALSDNITFFASVIDQDKVKACAKLAAIHDDIMAMPMGYATLVGDMGAALSGGQKQRVLLARALYAEPKILFLDEATSHVDGKTESHIHQSIAKLRMTRIIITHRKETLEIADRIVSMKDIQNAAGVTQAAA